MAKIHRKRFHDAGLLFIWTRTCSNFSHSVTHSVLCFCNVCFFFGKNFAYTTSTITSIRNSITQMMCSIPTFCVFVALVLCSHISNSEKCSFSFFCEVIALKRSRTQHTGIHTHTNWERTWHYSKIIKKKRTKANKQHGIKITREIVEKSKRQIIVQFHIIQPL